MLNNVYLLVLLKRFIDKPIQIKDRFENTYGTTIFTKANDGSKQVWQLDKKLTRLKLIGDTSQSTQFNDNNPLATYEIFDLIDIRER